MEKYQKLIKEVKSQPFETFEEAKNALLISIAREKNPTSWETITQKNDKYYFSFLTYIYIGA